MGIKSKLSALRNWAPLGGFIILFALFAGLTNGDNLGISNLQSLLNQVMVMALVATGAVFVFGSGSIDMSMGACVSLSAVLGGMVGIETGSIALVLLVCVGSAIALGLLKGLFAAYVEAPSFIITIVMGMVITACVLVMMGDTANLLLPTPGTEPNTIPIFDFEQMTIVNLITLIGFFALCWMLFSLGTLGRSVKMTGGSLVVARQTGLPIRRTVILSYLLGALGIGLAAFILVIRTRTVGANTGISMGTDVLVALVLGGMPLTGGPRSSIYAGLIGAASITVLTNGLTMIGLELEYIQICRGLVFIAVVFIASMSYRTKLLPR